MKALFYTLCCTAALLLLASCGGKKKYSIPPVTVEPDSTMYVLLTSHTSDSITFVQLDSKRTRTMGYAYAHEQHALIGDLNDGDTLAVMPQFSQKRIVSAVNVSQLVGLWMYENPEGCGIRLNSDGAACNIGPTSHSTLRDWRIRNGKFILTYVKSDGSDYALRNDSSEIKMLTKDKLVYTLHDSVITCSRTDALIRLK